MLNIKDYIVQNRQFKKFEIDDLLFVEYKCVIDQDKVGFWTDNNYFIYVLGGKKKWQTIEDCYYAKDGDILFLKRGAYLSQRFLDEEFCAIQVFVPDEFIRSVFFKLSHHRSMIHHKVESDSILRIENNVMLDGYFNSVLSYFQSNVKPPKELLKIKFEELIINILLNPNNQGLKSYFQSICETNKIRIQDIMEINFTKNLTIEEFARLCGRSLSTFKRDFVKTYCITPGKWLTRKRLNHAKHLLESTALDVNEIAFESGFENSSHFIRIFKSKFGITPLKYRISKERSFQQKEEVSVM